MKKIIYLGIFISCSVFMSFGQSNLQLTFTEVMFNTSIKNTEFVEIFNQSYSDSVDLRNLKFLYSSSKADILIHQTANCFLQPRSFAVILEKDYDFEEDIYCLDNFAVLLQTSDNAFGRSGLANSSDRKIFLLTSEDDTICTYTYTANNDKNFSDEIINVDKSSSENWKNSVVEFGTPGRINSVSPPDYDLEVKIVNHSPAKPFYGEPITFEYDIKNVGLKSINNADISFAVDLNKDSTVQSNEILHQKFIGSIDPDQIVNKKITFNNIYFGNNIFMLEAFCKADKKLNNNRDYVNINIIKPACEKEDILISEVMFAPFSEEPEWIELYNNSNKTINLQNWRIYDRSSNSVLISEKFDIKPNNYLVIAKDDSFYDFYQHKINYIISQFPSLNNSEDELIIKDSLNITIDSLFYLGEWINNTKGKSLERKDFSISSNNITNWQISQDRGTPGIINSVATKDYNVKIDSIIIYPEIPVLNENIHPSASITNYGKKDCEITLKLYLYDETEELIHSEKRINISAQTSNFIKLNCSLMCNETNSQYKLMLICEKDYDKTNNEIIFEVNPISPEAEILFSEIMFDPEENNTEWIELKNNSNYAVNLKGWYFRNYSPGGFNEVMIKKDILINKYEHFILTTNKENFSSGNIIDLNIGSLNNTEDILTFHNFYGNMTDSLKYCSNWKINKEHSLERISFDKKNTSENWHFSLSENKSTPLQDNSVIQLEKYNFEDLLINEIMYEPGLNNSEFIEIHNPTNFEIELGGWSLTEGGLKVSLSDRFYRLAPNDYFVIANDSIIFNSFPELKDKIKIEKSISLSNTSDKISILDAFGNLIDSVTYNENWNNSNIYNTTNKSLEKIRQEYSSCESNNWSTSVDRKGSTPLKVNSIKLSPEHKSIDRFSIKPNPFSPDNDGFEDFTEFKYNLKSPVSQIIIRIFDDVGRLVRTLENYSSIGSEGSIIYDGKDDNGNPLRIGIYIFHFEAFDMNNNSKISFTKPIVIARKL